MCKSLERGLCIAGFQHQQTVVLQSQKAQLNNLAFNSKSGLLLLGNALGSTLVVLHLSEALDSFDAIARFEVIVPIISLEELQVPSDSPNSEVLQVPLRSHRSSFLNVNLQDR